MNQFKINNLHYRENQYKIYIGTVFDARMHLTNISVTIQNAYIKTL